MDWTPSVSPDIRDASTIPSRTYHDPEVFLLVVDRVLARCWHPLADAGEVKAPGHVRPFTLLPGSLDEPLLLARGEDGELRCLSNVCTHRGALVVDGEGHVRGLRCRYHGRKFDLAGRFVSMPEFDNVTGFPSPADDLPWLPIRSWGPIFFAGIDPAVPFDSWIAPVRDHLDWLEPDTLLFDPAASRDYTLDANWALYVDNYLEGFHIPYIHGRSLTGLDYDAYRTERFAWGNLQVGIAREGEPVLELPATHPLAGERVAGLYFWLFPNFMVNAYPWGLSTNEVKPVGPDHTVISFRAYVRDPSLRSRGAGSALHRVEMEDEEVVASCMRGVRSRLYDRGRFSARREIGTHHFHTLLDRFLATPPDAAFDPPLPEDPSAPSGGEGNASAGGPNGGTGGNK